MSMTIVFKHPGYPEKKWRKGFKIAGGFPGVDVISCGIMDDVFAVKGENIDQDKLLEKIKKVLKSVEIIDHTKYPPDYFFYDF
ncbi:hypothetical protein AtNW77_Chr5g0137611 [Arabidopsis thaliana]|uniref:Uncharacterized protein n=1 Tax=Arabidopsis thaliana TaxID=3702 RepID=A0A1P8BDC6_ARATH|nr:uncharacterized protein AT5G52655 [Arabidopsis thaliana]ANM69579.1 hypothetical protein AT5G52655 [Arabidopsis thaliana]|eukprot:NP_001331246.1 hypothetical protein AT5G52655 [Arabidopsis thaliana]